MSPRRLAWVALLAVACKAQPPEPQTPPTPVVPNSAPSVAASNPPVAPSTTAATARHHREPGTEAQLVGLQEAGAALARGDQAGAVARYETVLAGPPTGAAVSAGLAAASLLEVDEPAAAEALYLKTLAIAGDVPEAHFAAGRFFGGRRDSVRAIRHLKQALDLEPDFLPAYPLLGGLLVAGGRQEEAAQRMVVYEQRLNRLLRHVREAERSAEERAGILELLSYIDDERALQAVIDRLKDGSPAVRMAAGGALVDLASPEAVTALAQAVVQEEQPVVREMLTSALRQARAALASQP
ncbi:MAG: HEAT repeat domain-containing protein [Myxococcales bacterium]|nr:HEAT repeat domain-containing protein [Myxococcales bacterium]